MRLRPYDNTPTLDIYFLQPLRDMIREGPFPAGRKPVRRMGPNSFICNGKAVIIRYVTEGELRRMARMRPRRCAYVIDDDLWSLDRDRSLPEDYRERLRGFRDRFLPRILRLCDTIVAPNPLILEACGKKKKEILTPSWSHLCANFDHFNDPRRIDLVFTGTRSHLRDFEFIASPLLELCRKHPELHLTSFLGEHAPLRLRNHRQMTHLAPMSWKRYKRMQRNKRFHVALAPYRDTPFNRARSVNKLLDHAAFGAAGIYSDLPPVSETIIPGRNGLLAGEKPREWFAAMETLLQDLARTRDMAAAGVETAARIGDRRRVRNFWLTYFGL